ncbi:MAG: NAD(P)H-hydrate dehydratase [Candidatus Desulfofervidus auxilii]|nr:NAD(P)H-hydrate dehydratase [Candidatus Desulfofervidus auxilii]
MKLVTANEMQAIDRFTIEEVGIPGEVLMENAARGALEHIKNYILKHLSDAVIGVLCGKGNNGGDGLVIARYLYQEGYLVKVFLFGEKTKLKNEAALNLKIAERLGVPIKEILNESDWQSAREYLIACDLIIDAMLGTGLKTEIRGLIKEAVSFLNNTFQGLVVAVDIPTGLSSDTGYPLGDAVKADLTITFALPKIGQVIYPGADYVGILEIVDIGIPPQVIADFSLKHHLVTTEDIKHLLRPRPAPMHKGQAGHVLVLAGSPGKTGAATLTCLGALRIGAGLVTLGIPKSLNPILEVKLTEAMTLPLPETKEMTLSLKAWNEIKESGINYKVICLGPGLSTHPEIKALVETIISEANKPLVIDADGLNVLNLEILKNKKTDIILTPHPGEMVRLIGVDKENLLKERVKLVKEVAEKYQVIVILKMARTLIATPDGEIFVNSTGNPAMATGGMGDVLTGIIGGLLSQGYPTKEAAILGVFLHGLAADLWVKKNEELGLLAGELVDYLPSAWKEVKESNEKMD